MYPWHTPAPPTVDLPFDGQIHVDDQNRISQWNATLGAWHRESEFYLKEVGRLWIEANTRPTVTPLGRMFASRIKNQWDGYYDKAFIEIRTSASAQVFYLAQMTYAELSSTILGALNQSGGVYTENAEVIIREVINPELGCNRTMVWNSIYSTARGRSSYNRRWGRSVLGLNDAYGVPDNWRGGAGYWTDGYTEPGRNFLQLFHGIVAPSNPTESDQLFWFHSSHYGLYRQPRVGSSVFPGNPRHVYDTSDASYKQCSAGQSFQVGSPRFLLRIANSTARSLDTPTHTSIIGSNLMRNRVGACVVYPLQNGTQYAFYLKPLGIDWIAFSLNSGASQQIVSESVYAGSLGKIRHVCSGEWRPDNNSLRLWIFDAIPTPRRQGGIDFAGYFSELSFFSRDPITGVRSETFETAVHLVRRKANQQIALEPRRA